MIPTHQLPRISRFFRGRVKNSKNTISIYESPENDSLFRDQVLYLFFRKSAKQWGELDFCGVKNASKVIKITHFDVLQGPFVHSDQASRRVSKIVQNYVKMHLKSQQNEHKKYGIRYCNGQKRTPSLDLRKRIKTRSFFIEIDRIDVEKSFSRKEAKSTPRRRKIVRAPKIEMRRFPYANI